MTKHEVWSAIWNARKAIDIAIRLADEFYEEEQCQDTPKKSVERKRSRMKQLLADISHIIVGVAVILSGWLSAMVAVIATVTFLTYEIVQWNYLGKPETDKPHRAIKYFLIGLILTSLFFSFDIIIGRVAITLFKFQLIFGG